ncbi:MAG: N-formylglutamate amidohydrolase [Pseudomonadota bacterium]
MSGCDPKRGFRWQGGLLAADEPDPVGHERRQGRSPVLLVVDHAGRRVPRRLGRLGLEESAFDRHIAWDIGALATARWLSEALDAELIYQRYSRLVIDCNRPPHVPSAFVTRPDGVFVEGNTGIDANDAAMRVSEVFHPYHATIAGALDRRAASRAATAIVAVHSFTPQHSDHPGPRPWQIGLLFNRDPRLANALAPLLDAEGDVRVGMNEPYVLDDDGDYSIPIHAEARGLAHVELEIRQDMITDEAGQRAWAMCLARLIPAALEGLGAPENWSLQPMSGELAEGDHG